jgi:hypothetical protein
LVLDVDKKERVLSAELDLHQKVDLVFISLRDVGEDLLVERNDLRLSVEIRGDIRQEEID